MEETMKCIKNKKTGNILRVANDQANNMVGRDWEFTSKSEWKAATREPAVEEQPKKDKK
jgi:hypothetical protein